jgi:hypothetical protein
MWKQSIKKLKAKVQSQHQALDRHNISFELIAHVTDPRASPVFLTS